MKDWVDGDKLVIIDAHDSVNKLRKGQVVTFLSHVAHSKTFEKSLIRTYDSGVAWYASRFKKYVQPDTFLEDGEE